MDGDTFPQLNGLNRSHVSGAIEAISSLLTAVKLFSLCSAFASSIPLRKTLPLQDYLPLSETLDPIRIPGTQENSSSTPSHVQNRKAHSSTTSIFRKIVSRKLTYEENKLFSRSRGGGGETQLQPEAGGGRGRQSLFSSTDRES